MTGHEAWEELAGRYRDGELTAAEQTAFEAHRAACPRCQEILAADAALAEGLRTMLDERFPDDLEDRLAARLAALSGPRGERIRGFGHWLRHGEFRIPAPVAVAAALLLVVLGLRLAVVRTPGDPLAGVPLTAAASGEQAVTTEVRDLLVRARILLLALDTAGPDLNGNYHLETEQRLSHDLVQQMRWLAEEPDYEDRANLLDLVMDLETILLDVSTWSDGADAQRLALVRNGIDDRSLLYRIDTFTDEYGGD